MSEIFNNQERAFIIYQMGKVGSSSIRASLEKVIPKKCILHTHSHEEAEFYINKWRQQFSKVVVITGFREPVNRCISAYFQNITNETNHWFVDKKEEVMRKNTDWLINDFNSKVVPHIQERIAPWLVNYEHVTNLKLSEFRNLNGYSKVSVENVHYYIYKLEQLGEFQEGMENDEHFTDIELIKANLSKEKWYRHKYAQFKERYKIRKEDYERIFKRIDYVQHLYAEQEINEVTKSFLVE